MTKEIYIVLTETNTVLSRGIRLYTQHEFNHVSLAFDSSLREMYSFGRKHENNPWIGGFVQENPASKLLRESNCAIYACPVTEAQYQMLQDKIDYYKKHQKNFKYNFVGLLGVACKVKLKRKRAFFCSQFIATLFKETGLSLHGFCPYFMKPNDFINLPSISLIYKGKVGDYIHYDASTQSKRYDFNSPIYCVISSLHKRKQNLLNR
ncbi:hypothetical protein D1B33_16495 [Lysinibacillus yapensis]|uniref:Uncharacterized protein n=1 Tax=Ureibacillus yapensis TaxID=2304605 RepID=A0A396S3E8_9BACL|nr:hypothetical protein [Lysinibacillus yapensis]RHW32766.1 hypothetical protein D1B33_16495 [Lysinibacillus yapensis]